MVEDIESRRQRIAKRREEIKEAGLSTEEIEERPQRIAKRRQAIFAKNIRVADKERLREKPPNCLDTWQCKNEFFAERDRGSFHLNTYRKVKTNTWITIWKKVDGAWMLFAEAEQAPFHYYHRKKRPGWYRYDMVINSAAFTPLRQCEKCGFLSTHKKVVHSSVLLDLFDPNEDIDVPKHILCWSCINKAKPLARAMRNAEECTKLIRKITNAIKEKCNGKQHQNNRAAS